MQIQFGQRSTSFQVMEVFFIHLFTISNIRNEWKVLIIKHFVIHPFRKLCCSQLRATLCTGATRPSPTIIDPNKTMSLVNMMIAMLRKVRTKCSFHFLRFMTQKGHRYSERAEFRFTSLILVPFDIFFFFRIPYFFYSYFESKRKECKGNAFVYFRSTRVLFNVSKYSAAWNICAARLLYMYKYKCFSKTKHKIKSMLVFKYLARFLSITL